MKNPLMEAMSVEDIRDRMTELDDELKVLKVVLDVKVRQAQQEAEDLHEPPIVEATKTIIDAAQQAAGKRGRITSQTYLGAMQTNPDRIWRVKEVVAVLNEQGIPATNHAPRHIIPAPKACTDGFRSTRPELPRVGGRRMFPQRDLRVAISPVAEGSISGKVGGEA